MSIGPQIFRPDVGLTLGNLNWRLLQIEQFSPRPDAQFDIKVQADDLFFIAGDGKFIFMIPEDLDTWQLSAVEAYVTTVGTGVTTLMIRNVTQAIDMLTTAITIDSGELSTCTATTPAVISFANSDVAHCDQIAIDIDAASVGAKGLGVILTFTPPEVHSDTTSR